MLGDLGRDRGFLYRNIVPLALCRDRGLCRDRVWSRLGGLVSRHINRVTAGWCNGGAPARVAMHSISAHQRVR